MLQLVLLAVFDIYARFPQFDVPMHFLGGIAMAFFLHRAAVNGCRFGILGPFHPLTHVVLGLGLTCMAAVFWEFPEFLVDSTFVHAASAKPGGYDARPGDGNYWRRLLPGGLAYLDHEGACRR